MSLTIDSTVYDVPIITMDRKGDALYKYAERTEDGVLHSELIGIYYNYSLAVGMSANNVSDYAALYTKLTEAVETHSITLLGDTFTCYFANIKDGVVKLGTTNYFRNLTFEVIAISPALTP
jgi:hypothetical protein